MGFKWNEKFATGIKVIDEEHQQLFFLGNQLVNVISEVREGMDKYDKIMEVLAELKSYTIYHFRHEEGLMKKADYEDYAEHKEYHEYFINKLDEIEFQNIDYNQDKAALGILEFLADWIKNHIVKTDRKYIKVLIEKGLVDANPI